MQRFLRPARPGQFVSQVIEQGGMCWRLAQQAKITGSVNDATAKMVQPQAVGQNPPHQGVIATEQGLHPGQSPAGGGHGSVFCG